METRKTRSKTRIVSKESDSDVLAKTGLTNSLKFAGLTEKSDKIQPIAEEKSKVTGDKESLVEKETTSDLGGSAVDEGELNDTDNLQSEVHDLIADQNYNEFVMNLDSGNISLDDEDDPDFDPVNPIPATKEADSNQPNDGMTEKSESHDDDEDGMSEDEDEVEFSTANGKPSEVIVKDVEVPMEMINEKNARYPAMWRTRYHMRHLEAHSYDSAEDKTFNLDNVSEEEIGEEEYASCEEEEADDTEDATLTQEISDGDLAKMVEDMNIEPGFEKAPGLGVVLNQSLDGYQSEDDPDFLVPQSKKLHAEDSDSSTDEDVMEEEVIVNVGNENMEQ